jgi:hypothetical protein
LTKDEPWIGIVIWLTPPRAAFAFAMNNESKGWL